MLVDELAVACDVTNPFTELMILQPSSNEVSDEF